MNPSRFGMRTLGSVSATTRVESFGACCGNATAAPSTNDLLVRDEVFVKPATWIQFAAGLDFRANSHNQVDKSWDIDFFDRGERRPRLLIRRLTATMTWGPFVVDVGKQFIRWGNTDIVNPTDRFAPRDCLNAVDSDFLAVTGLRGAAQVDNYTFEAVWVPRRTPSRSPLIYQRWTVLPSGPTGVPITVAPSTFPKGSQSGVRWGHVADNFDYSVSFFHGFNHLPDITGGGTTPAWPA